MKCTKPKPRGSVIKKGICNLRLVVGIHWLAFEGDAMWISRRLHKSRMLLLFGALAICCQSKVVEWPHYVTSSILVPEGARNIRYYTIYGSYQVEYQLEECYPCKSFIQATQRKMEDGKWRRLEYDFLNPTIKLNHARGPGGVWSHIIDKDGKSLYQWIDDWKDDQGNIVTYGLRYRAEFESKKDPCILEVIVIYIPSEIVKNAPIAIESR